MTVPSAMSDPSSKAGDGISSSISAVLVVALVVVLVWISAAVFMGFTAAPSQAPILGISIDMKGDTVLVSHLNGAVLPAGTYAVLVDGVDRTQMFTPPGNFGPGTILTWSAGSEAVGTISVISKEGGQSMLLALKSFDRKGGGGLGTLVINGNSYDIRDYRGTLQDLKDSVKEGNVLVQKGTTFTDENGDYWAYAWSEGPLNSNKLNVYRGYFVKLNPNSVVVCDDSSKTCSQGDLVVYRDKLYVFSGSDLPVSESNIDARIQNLRLLEIT